MTKVDVYGRLAAAYRRPGSKFLPMILQSMVNEEEAEILLKLPENMENLPEKTGWKISAINKFLERAYKEGLVFYYYPTPQTKHYALMTNYIDAILGDKRINKKGEAFFKLWRQFSEEIDNEPVEEYVPMSRVLPVTEVISRKEEILPYEDVREIIKGARTIVLSECACRKREQNCNNPLDNCLIFDNAAEYALSRNAGKKISLKKALAILKESEERGLVHETSSSSYGLEFICNCCPCCCYFLKKYLKHGSYGISIRSRYRCQIDKNSCMNCGACVRRCHFGALSMNGGLLNFNAEKCIGCGLCATKCPSGAIDLIAVEDASFIPEKEPFTLFNMTL